MAPSANFHLPVVFENLRDPESLHQLLDSLEALDRVAEEVFGRITKRVQQQRSDLQGIQTRLSAAEVRTALPCVAFYCQPGRACRFDLVSVRHVWLGGIGQYCSGCSSQRRGHDNL
jgi:hypothetical protein